MLILGVGARRSGNFWPDVSKAPTILRLRWDGAQWNTTEVGAITGVPRNKNGAYLNIYSIAVNPTNPKEMFLSPSVGSLREPETAKRRYLSFNQ